jgi:hypothetical protein
MLDEVPAVPPEDIERFILEANAALDKISADAREHLAAIDQLIPASSRPSAYRDALEEWTQKAAHIAMVLGSKKTGFLRDKNLRSLVKTGRVFVYVPGTEKIESEL